MNRIARLLTFLLCPKPKRVAIPTCDGEGGVKMVETLFVDRYVWVPLFRRFRRCGEWRKI